MPAEAIADRAGFERVGSGLGGKMQQFLLSKDPDARLVQEEGVSLDEAILLVEEIKTLEGKLAACQRRIDELSHLAHWDPIVDLPNRRSFTAMLERIVARTNRHGGDAAMLFIDVDGLKAINDRFGHPNGDRTLRMIARLLEASVRKEDYVARLSGDEFAILLENTAELAAWQTALRVIAAVDEFDFEIDSVRIALSVAVGVAAVLADDTPMSVFERADKEMYRIKAIGSRPCATFNSAGLAGLRIMGEDQAV